MRTFLPVILLFYLSSTNAQQPVIKGPQGVSFDYVIHYANLHERPTKYVSTCTYAPNEYYQFSIKTVAFTDQWVPVNYRFHLVKKTSETKEKNQVTFYWYDAISQTGEKYAVGFEVNGYGWIQLFTFDIEQNGAHFKWVLTNDDSKIKWN